MGARARPTQRPSVRRVIGLDDVPELEGVADKVRGDDLFLRYELEEKIERVGVDKASVDVDVRDPLSRCRIGEVLSTPSAIWDARSAGVERSNVNPCSPQRNGGRPELSESRAAQGCPGIDPSHTSDSEDGLSAAAVIIFLGVKRNESSRLQGPQ